MSQDFTKKTDAMMNELHVNEREYLEILHMFGAHMKRDW
jgi:hypothetical protein